jgi:hypothetical protein
MFHDLKAFGLVCIGVFAMSAVVASAASAAKHHFTAPKGAEIEVVKNDTQFFRATTDDLDFVSCNKITATGTITQETSDELTVHPEYSECIADKGGTEVAVKVNTSECSYVFTGETTAGNPTNGEHANLYIEDISGDGTCHIQMTVTAFNFKCVSIPNQLVTDAVNYEQIDAKTIRVNATPHSVESTTTNSVACPTETGGTVVHKGHTEDSGVYRGSVDVSVKQGGETKNFTLTKNVTP